MFTENDYQKLRRLMAQSPENEILIQKLLDSHRETLRTISHEIRNPFTLVYSTLQLMESRHPELSSYQHWDSLKSDVEYIKILLEDLSSLNNGDSLCCDEFHFRRFMENLALSFAASLGDGKVEFTSYIDPCLPCIYGDRIKLKQVFLNLLRNAYEAVLTKAEGGTIRLNAVRRGPSVCVEIRDSGCGIPRQRLEDIFTPFVTYKQGGTGLGLAIARRIVSAHHGRIQVRSAEGRGSSFAVTLPIQQNPQEEPRA